MYSISIFRESEDDKFRGFSGLVLGRCNVKFNYFYIRGLYGVQTAHDALRTCFCTTALR